MTCLAISNRPSLRLLWALGLLFCTVIALVLELQDESLFSVPFADAHFSAWKRSRALNIAPKVEQSVRANVALDSRVLESALHDAKEKYLMDFIPKSRRSQDKFADLAKMKDDTKSYDFQNGEQTFFRMELLIANEAVRDGFLCPEDLQTAENDYNEIAPGLFAIDSGDKKFRWILGPIFRMPELVALSIKAKNANDPKYRFMFNSIKPMPKTSESSESFTPPKGFNESALTTEHFVMPSIQGKDHTCTLRVRPVQMISEADLRKLPSENTDNGNYVKELASEKGWHSSEGSRYIMLGMGYTARPEMTGAGHLSHLTGRWLTKDFRAKDVRHTDMFPAMIDGSPMQNQYMKNNKGLPGSTEKTLRDKAAKVEGSLKAGIAKSKRWFHKEAKKTM